MTINAAIIKSLMYTCFAAVQNYKLDALRHP